MKIEPKLYHLANGVPVILDPMDLETAYVNIVFKTGACDEKPDEYGITHFCEHMFCKGSKRFPTQKARKDFLENHGGAINASTSNIALRFYGRIIADNLSVLIDVLSEMLENALFDEKQMETERGAILDEMRRALDKPDRMMWDFGMKKLFNTFVPNGTMRLGSAETIKSFTPEQLRKYATQHMSAKNCVITISGRIDSVDDIIAQLEKCFAFLPTHDVTQNMALTYTPCVAHCSSEKSKNVKISVVFQNTVPDTYENRYVNRCIGRFNSYLRRELQEVLRQQNGLVYGVGFAYYGYPDYEATGFDTETAPENVARVVELMAQTAYRVYSQNPINQAELDKMFNLGRLVDADFLESSVSRCDTFNEYYRFYNRLFDYADSVQIKKSITPDDVVKYSRGIFDTPMSIITYGADFDADLAQIWKDNFK